MGAVADNLASVREKINLAAVGAGRNPDTISLVAVSKRVTPQRIAEAVAAGQLLFGENYLQEAVEKMAPLAELLGYRGWTGPPPSWHFIGHLQSNKARVAAENFAMLETVDRLKTARALDKYSRAAGRVLPVLVQVNMGGEPQKSGVAPDQLGGLLEELALLPALEVAGLMTMPPFTEEPEDSRPLFRGLRELSSTFSKAGLLPSSSQLSMGMSSDYQVAVEEGATLVRVGSAIFGAR